MIRTLIVDDEPMARAGLAALLRGDSEIEIVGECCSGTEAVEVIRADRPDLVFLDVQMPGFDGFEVLEQLGEGAPAAVVFVTAYDHYALKAFEVGAQDYLLKPFDDARFFRVLTRVKSQLQRPSAEPRHLDRVMIRSAGRVTFLRAAEIDWIEAADYYASLHVGPRTHLLRRSMSDLERDVDPAAFCRVHRSAIVNVARVRELRLDANGEYEIHLADGTKVRMSRSYREQLQARLGVGA